MKTVRLSKLVKLSILKDADKSRLVRFFNVFSKQLNAANVAIPAPSLKDEQFHRALVNILKAPDQLPAEVTDALMMIEDLADRDIVESLKVKALDKGILVAFTAGSYMDVLFDLYAHHRAFFIHEHREYRAQLLTSFEFYSAKEPASGPFTLPAKAACRNFEAALNPWFKKHGRGEFALVDPWEVDGQFWFQISHGDPLVQTGIIKNNKRRIERFQPDKDDVIVYDPATSELRVNARTPGERDLYARAFGITFFGNEKVFAKANKFTFAPLHKGEAALNFRKHPELADKLQRVDLVFLSVNYGTPTPGVITYKSPSVFATLRVMNATLQPEHEILRASFALTFKAEPNRPRLFRLSTQSRLSTSRMADQAIARLFFFKMGFLTAHPQPELEPEDAAPASTSP